MSNDEAGDIAFAAAWGSVILGKAVAEATHLLREHGAIGEAAGRHGDEQQRPGGAGEQLLPPKRGVAGCLMPKATRLPQLVLLLLLRQATAAAPSRRPEPCRGAIRRRQSRA
mmetsp:Transcript_47343/g.152001  ORF Transcript_47343/g.152001 Transcript_47343/m.152001 type:complete len:112 (+) Transcript_47343:1759-2094(+)